MTKDNYEPRTPRVAEVCVLAAATAEDALRQHSWCDPKNEFVSTAGVAAEPTVKTAE